jgi:copper transport protein
MYIRVWFVLLASLLLVFGVMPVQAHQRARIQAHAEYVHSIPAADSAVDVAPRTVQVWFSEEVAAGGSTLSLRDVKGAAWDNGDSHLAPDDKQSLMVTLKALPRGAYTVIWATLSADDAHADKGSFTFIVGKSDDGVSYTALVQQVERTARALQPPAPLDAAVRFLLLLSMILLAGGMAFVLVVMRVQALNEFRSGIALQRRRFLWATMIFACLAITLNALFFAARNDLGDPGARYRWVLAVRIASMLTLIAALAMRRDEQAWVLVPLGLLLLTQSLLSHSAAEGPWSLLTDWLHLLFSALWLGGVAVLAFVIVPVARQGRWKELGLVIARFSPLAVFSVLTIALTGIVQSASFVGSIEALTGAAYGRTILVKVVLLLVLVGFGAFHQQVIAPRLQAWRLRDGAGVAGATHATHRFGLSILAEMAVSVMLIVAVGVLTALPPARDVTPSPDAAVMVIAAQGAGDDLVYVFGLAPGMAGVNQFDLYVTTPAGEPAPGVEQVYLRFSEQSMDMGETELILRNAGDGHYVGRSFSIPMAGRWQVVSTVRRSGLPDAQMAFTLTVRLSLL